MDICYINDNTIQIWEVKSEGARDDGPKDLSIYFNLIYDNLERVPGHQLTYKGATFSSVELGFSIKGLSGGGRPFLSGNGHWYSARNDESQQGLIIYKSEEEPDAVFEAGTSALAEALARLLIAAGGRQPKQPEPGPVPQPPPVPKPGWPGLHLPTFPVPGLP